MVKLWFGALSNYGTVRGEHGGIVGGQHDKKKKKTWHGTSVECEPCSGGRRRWEVCSKEGVQKESSFCGK